MAKHSKLNTDSPKLALWGRLLTCGPIVNRPGCVAARSLAILLAALPSFAADESFLPETSALRATAIRIPMRDGQAIAADIYIPKAGGKFPVVLVQTPYDRKLHATLFDRRPQHSSQSSLHRRQLRRLATDRRADTTPPTR